MPSLVSPVPLFFVFLWSTGFIVAKFGLPYAPPLTFLLLRYACAVAVLAPLVWLLMLAWSKPWLDRFHYGPLEWLWRSLARMELQQMRKRPPSLAAAAE